MGKKGRDTCWRDGGDLRPILPGHNTSCAYFDPKSQVGLQETSPGPPEPAAGPTQKGLRLVHPIGSILVWWKELSLHGERRCPTCFRKAQVCGEEGLALLQGGGNLHFPTGISVLFPQWALTPSLLLLFVGAFAFKQGSRERLVPKSSHCLENRTYGFPRPFGHSQGRRAAARATKGSPPSPADLRSSSVLTNKIRISICQILKSSYQSCLGFGNHHPGILVTLME